jgi:P-type Ca2+ transporter type 2C
MFINNPW